MPSGFLLILYVFSLKKKNKAMGDQKYTCKEAN